jgi:hypothetical protein
VIEKKAWEKEFESDTGSSCLISVEKMIKKLNKAKKKGRERTNNKGGSTNRWTNGTAECN